jgi:hypothetical protein
VGVFDRADLLGKDPWIHFKSARVVGDPDCAQPAAARSQQPCCGAAPGGCDLVNTARIERTTCKACRDPLRLSRGGSKEPRHFCRGSGGLLIHLRRGTVTGISSVGSAWRICDGAARWGWLIQKNVVPFSFATLRENCAPSLRSTTRTSLLLPASRSCDGIGRPESIRFICVQLRHLQLDLFLNFLNAAALLHKALQLVLPSQPHGRNRIHPVLPRSRAAGFERQQAARSPGSPTTRAASTLRPNANDR